MDMRSLLTSLEVIDRVCTHEKGTPDQEKSEKSSHKSKKGKKRPGTSPTVRVPKKVRFEKHCNLCKKHGGAHTTHNTGECRKYEKDGLKNPVLAPLRKAEREIIPLTRTSPS